MKKILKKLNKVTISLIVVGVILLLLLFDFVWAKTYQIEVAEIDPPNPVCSGMNADEISNVNITLQVTHFGKPVSGHKIIGYSLVNEASAGTFIENIVRTDEDGYAVFQYTVYAQAPFSPVSPVNMIFFDEDNSIVFEINAELRFDLPVRQREEGGTV